MVTPYGATKTNYFAVSAEHKLDKDKRTIKGKVGHDRIQQGLAGESIGEAIRKWYLLKNGDFDWIDIDVQTIDDAFYLTPLKVRFSNSGKGRDITGVHNPLTLTTEYASPFWKEQIGNVEKKLVAWSLGEIDRIVSDHRKPKKAHILEADLLRASGPLNHLGLKLGPLRGKGYDCRDSVFQFLRYPSYIAPVEIKRESKDFKYQQGKYGKEELSRAVILCAFHNLRNTPRNIDVIELNAFEHLGKL